MSEIMPCISPLGAEERSLTCVDADLLLRCRPSAKVQHLLLPLRVNCSLEAFVPSRYTRKDEIVEKSPILRGHLSPNMPQIHQHLFAQKNYPERSFTGRMNKQEEKSKQANSGEKLVSKG